MPDLSNYKEVSAILEKNGFNLKKSLGQNFLINPSVCPKMAESACDGDIGILEIGPGAGVLTAELCRRAKKVVAVEIDRRLEPVLKETLAEFDNLTVIFGDVMSLDLGELIRQQFGQMRVAVCANLPYYITSPVLMMLFESRLPLESVTVMVQKEAADRLCAEMGKRECGAVTAAVRYYTRPKVLFGVSKGSFMPPPKVDSAVIRFDILPQPPVSVGDEKKFFALIKAAFGTRRKTLANSLSMRLGLSKDSLAAAFDRCGISPTARAEQLTLEQFAALSNDLYGAGVNNVL